MTIHTSTDMITCPRQGRTELKNSLFSNSRSEYHIVQKLKVEKRRQQSVFNGIHGYCPGADGTQDPKALIPSSSSVASVPCDILPSLILLCLNNFGTVYSFLLFIIHVPMGDLENVHGWRPPMTHTWYEGRNTSCSVTDLNKKDDEVQPPTTNPASRLENADTVDANHRIRVSEEQGSAGIGGAAFESTLDSDRAQEDQALGISTLRPDTLSDTADDIHHPPARAGDDHAEPAASCSSRSQTPPVLRDTPAVDTPALTSTGLHGDCSNPIPRLHSPAPSQSPPVPPTQPQHLVSSGQGSGTSVSPAASFSDASARNGMHTVSWPPQNLYMDQSPVTIVDVSSQTTTVLPECRCSILVLFTNDTNVLVQRHLIRHASIDPQHFQMHDGTMRTTIDVVMPIVRTNDFCLAELRLVHLDEPMFVLCFELVKESPFPGGDPIPVDGSSLTSDGILAHAPFQINEDTPLIPSASFTFAFPGDAATGIHYTAESHSLRPQSYPCLDPYPKYYDVPAQLAVLSLALSDNKRASAIAKFRRWHAIKAILVHLGVLDDDGRSNDGSILVNGVPMMASQVMDWLKYPYNTFKNKRTLKCLAFSDTLWNLTCHGRKRVDQPLPKLSEQQLQSLKQSWNVGFV
ncbi:hypothetical protein CALVIDRAFT_530899 [Calocera viscosa TUFC12733]|uniref:Uncharacterized protein n=1 Tax=Calocera viscosa (strain TUFC12733) TaxID=1330018 RepID=A0A167H6G7_CALVF|nr:hypothetical protein CALVIDRAFT_530899 [Calocera viscosa TUFC12733]